VPEPAARRVRLAAAAVLAVLAALMALAFSSEQVRGFAAYLWLRLHGGYTVEQRLALHGAAVQARLGGEFAAAGLPYPPHELAYVSFKDTRHLEVYGRAAPDAPWVFVKEYPVLGASGGPGPKLAEGDGQVPEGIYRAESLNPNSRFHLSIRLNYPNEFDQRMALADGRQHLGGDIMIHGSSASIGCLAMGDPAAEDLFVLAALVSPERLLVIISPTDFRAAPVLGAGPQPAWVRLLYASLRSELGQFRRRT
jgi:hypothetical protein